MNKRETEIRERCDRATEGPWKTGGRSWTELIISSAGIHPANHFIAETRGAKIADAEFISHAREDIPYLLDKNERIREAINIYKSCGLWPGKDQSLAKLESVLNQD